VSLPDCSLRFAGNECGAVPIYVVLQKLYDSVIHYLFFLFLMQFAYSTGPNRLP